MSTTARWISALFTFGFTAFLNAADTTPPTLNVHTPAIAQGGTSIEKDLQVVDWTWTSNQPNNFNQYTMTLDPGASTSTAPGDLIIINWPGHTAFPQVFTILSHSPPLITVNVLNTQDPFAPQKPDANCKYDIYTGFISGSITTGERTPIIKGIAGDNTLVTSLTCSISGSTVANGTITGTDSWTVTIPTLADGANFVTITASDAAGNSSATVLAIQIDPLAPWIHVMSPSNTGQISCGLEQLLVSGVAGDDVSVSAVSWTLAGATSATGTATGSLSWALQTPMLSTGRSTLTVQADDGAGHFSSQSIVIDADPANPLVNPPANTHSKSNCGSGGGLGILLALIFIGHHTRRDGRSGRKIRDLTHR
jgi:hypothetical protein